ncbi:14853_t:CDS:2, partial [Entrophospora sp. SA101]
MIKIWSIKKDNSAAEKKKPKVKLALPETMQMNFPDDSDLLNFNLTIKPDEGFYRGGVFRFTFNINNNYPHDPPKVHYWKPVLNLNSVLVGLQYLFLEPNADDPLNK